jgi:hypothetical protein
MVRDGQQLDGRSFSAAIERLARWWTSATNAERFALWRAALEGEAQAPTLDALRVASYLAEVEAGEVTEG